MDKLTAEQRRLAVLRAARQDGATRCHLWAGHRRVRAERDSPGGATEEDDEARLDRLSTAVWGSTAWLEWTRARRGLAAIEMSIAEAIARLERSLVIASDNLVRPCCPETQF